MNRELFDLVSDYLLSSFSATTSTGLSRLLEDAVSHDQVSRMLNSEQLTPRDWWLMVKPHVRAMQAEHGVISVDDSIVEKPYTDENEIICWHYDHTKGRTVKGINFVTALYEVNGITLPVSYRLVAKTEWYIDKEGKEKRRSPVTKNEFYREMLQQSVQNQIPFRYVLNDLWFGGPLGAADNMRFVKLELLKVRTKKHHYALKTQPYISALKQAFDTLRSLQPVRLTTVTA